MSRLHDVAIIGAGAAGSTLALLLARAGWNVALVDKDVFPRRKVCGECIAAGNLALFDELGLGRDLLAVAGAELRSMELWVGSRRVRADLPPAPGAYPWGRALGREHLDVLLLEGARRAGAEVLQACVARALERTMDRDAPWSVALSTEEGRTATLQARTIVLANGSWSKPLSSKGRRTPHRAHDLFAFKANFRGSRLPPGVLPVFAFEGGYGGMVIAEDARATLAFCVRRDTLSTLRQRYAGVGAAEAVALHLLETCAGIEDVLNGATREGAWLAAGPLRPGVRVSDHRAGVFRVGNAAGEAHPIIGEGISMAVQGAALLSRQLLAGGPRRDFHAWDAAAATYAREWRRKFVGRIRMAAMCAHAAMRPALAPALFPLLQRHPVVLTAAARLAAKARRPLLPPGHIPERGAPGRKVPSRSIQPKETA